MASKGNSLYSLTHSGVTEEMDFQLQRRVVLSNWVAVIAGIVSIVFVVWFTFSGRSGNNHIMLLLGSVALSTIWFNKSGYVNTSRLMVCLIPSVFIMIMNVIGKMSTPDLVAIEHYTSSRLVILSSIVFPFTLFLNTEKKYLLFSLAVVLSLGFFYEKIHGFFGVGLVDLAIDASAYGVIWEDMFIMLVILFSASVFSFNLNKKSQDINESLLQEASRKNNELNANEEQLKKTLKEVEEARREDDKRRWASEGAGKIVSMLQSKSDIEEVYDNLVSMIVAYLEANQGGLYIVNHSDDGVSEIELTASYAYDRRRFEHKIIKPGESLLGQAFLEGEVIHLDDLPEDYLNITSGLGDANPKYVLIVPFKANDVIEGLLELASFKVFEDYQVDFLSEIGESIASSIAANKVILKTKELLADTNEMTNHIKAQEELMRQNMEELQASQEELSRKEMEYKRVIKELKEELEGLRSKQ